MLAESLGAKIPCLGEYRGCVRERPPSSAIPVRGARPRGSSARRRWRRGGPGALGGRRRSRRPARVTIGSEPRWTEPAPPRAGLCLSRGRRHERAASVAFGPQASPMRSSPIRDMLFERWWPGAGGRGPGAAGGRAGSRPLGGFRAGRFGASIFRPPSLGETAPALLGAAVPAAVPRAPWATTPPLGTAQAAGRASWARTLVPGPRTSWPRPWGPPRPRPSRPRPSSNRRPRAPSATDSRGCSNDGHTVNVTLAPSPQPKPRLSRGTATPPPPARHADKAVHMTDSH